VRDPVDPTSFWVNPFGMHFSLIRDEDLIRVDHEGKVVDGGRNRRLNYGTHYSSTINYLPLLAIRTDRCSRIRNPCPNPHRAPRRPLRRALPHHLWTRHVRNRENPPTSNSRFLRLL
jgi:hypothetical protein